MTIGRVFVRSQSSGQQRVAGGLLELLRTAAFAKRSLKRALYRSLCFMHEELVVSARDAVHLELHGSCKALALSRDGGCHGCETLGCEGAALIEHALRGVPYREAVHKHDAALHDGAAAHAPRGKLQALAVLADEHVLMRNAGRFSKLRVGAQVRRLSPCTGMKAFGCTMDSTIFSSSSAGVPRNMHARTALVVHVCADLRQRVDHARDRLLVAGNRAWLK